MSLLSGLRGGSDVGFDSYGTFVPERNPDPGPFLSETAVLTGDDHATFHRLTMDLFDERGVYDMTFGYNLARLNLDHRHPDAGFRYGRETDDSSVLRAEFTPTTEFCPQSDTLTVGAFRAWNGLSDRHEYDRVRVRVSPNHHQSASINDKLQQLETRYRQTGELRTDGGDEASDDSVPF
ncbi:hypothetical protein G9463_19455 [Haloarcula sp. JP-Z28]|uniref:DUF7998 domain-containing protein n=1 Tax=Haloarcula marismortui (strain ATCC 43049 / DSM 3752 / JCM 8966 / VKM B-1809) TaxID=272569 RepID=Q5V2D6_HALMA|nr:MULTISPECIES: hypothetical protein [Haloarcula]AAV46316.1 unknown [Haloarcula marismortui ATCC 43049]NHN65457.1 hypothetical protein [Haloarcula sp. JP-Z28]QCP91052.1 hypothetical protein E6P14_09330 [Haloarcula marismortui ATCC 43049]